MRCGNFSREIFRQIFHEIFHDARPGTSYIIPMQAVLPYLMGIAMFATLGVVVVGVISFAVHGNFYRRHSNNLMRARVAFQAIALLFFAFLMYGLSQH